MASGCPSTQLHTPLSHSCHICRGTVAVCIPSSTYPPQNLLHPSLGDLSLSITSKHRQIPLSHLSLPTLAALPSHPSACPAPPSSLEGNAGKGSGPPFCLRSRWGWDREGIMPLPHIPSMLGLEAVTTASTSWVAGTSSHRGEHFQRFHKMSCSLPCVALRHMMSNIKYYLWNFLLIAV